MYLAFLLDAWRGRRTVVARAGGGARLWLDREGELCDANGQLTVYDPEERVDLCELAAYVAEWLVHAAEAGQPATASEIHPELRQIVRALVPSAVLDDA